ncbi:hypothetical protein pb186bvf_021032 [Paramecium bursaria]
MGSKVFGNVRVDPMNPVLNFINYFFKGSKYNLKLIILNIFSYLKEVQNRILLLINKCIIQTDSASGIGASPATHQMSLNVDRSIY